jgi:hypothetical protein
LEKGGGKGSMASGPARHAGHSIGWAEGYWAERLNRPAGQLGRLDRNGREILFEIKIRILNLPRLWKFAQGDLEGILTQGFFLNSSRILKDFRKKTICHAMNATLSQIKLRKTFLCYFFQKCKLMHS